MTLWIAKTPLSKVQRRLQLPPGKQNEWVKGMAFPNPPSELNVTTALFLVAGFLESGIT